MKILLTADPEIPVPPKLYGGIERIIDVLVKGYTKLGHDVTLLAHSDSIVPCKHISWNAKQSTGLINTVVNTKQLFSQVMKRDYDVVHSFSRLAYLMPLLPLRVPKIMSYQREPTISQIKKANQLARKNTLLFTGCSNYISYQIEPFAPSITVYNCVPIETYQFCANVSDDAPLVFLGRIEPVKGTHLAIEVAEKTNRRLIIAGNIPTEWQGYFNQQIKPRLNNRIEYVGPVNDEQKNKILGSAAAFLMPIQWNEPFGIVMAEAMACGTPVLGFPYGAVPEVVENGVNGFICKDMEEMIAAIYQLSSIPREAVREVAERRFSDTVIVNNYLELYTQHTSHNSIKSLPAKA